MKFLCEEQYQKILEPLKALPFNTLFARAVLENKAKGTVYVDNQDKPKTIFIANSYGMSLLFGDTTNEEFNKSLIQYMMNNKSHRIKYEWLQVYPDTWNTKLSELLGDNIVKYSTLAESYQEVELISLIDNYRRDKIIQWGRVNFKYVNNTLIQDKKYNIQRIDSIIYDKIKGTVIPKHFWNTKELFLTEGIGYALMDGEEVASVAFSSCMFTGLLEIGIETVEKYRGFGYAKQVCRELISFCIENSYTPIWACRRENTGSYNLAKSLGFEEDLVLPYYELVSN